MVNTFLPWPDEVKTAKSLDNKRLGKQRVEALQILRANLGLTIGWRNHPAAVMWRGHEGALAQYICAICDEWEARGYEDNVRAQVFELWKANDFPAKSFDRPWWWGKRQIHRSHKSNLKRKNPEHYNFNVPDDLPYRWPTPEGTFRSIIKKEKKDGSIQGNNS
jgi:hypothetical protein